MRQIDGLTNDGHGVGGVGNVAGDEKQEDGDGDEDGDAERHLLAGLHRQTEDAEQDRRQDDARAEDVHEVEHELAAHVDRAVDFRERLHQVVLVDDVRAGDARVEHRPLAVRDVRVKADVAERVGQVDLVRRVHPRLDLDGAVLVVERVVVHVEGAGDDEDAARLPARAAVIAHRHPEALEVVGVKQLVGTGNTTQYNLLALATQRNTACWSRQHTTEHCRGCAVYLLLLVRTIIK